MRTSPWARCCLQLILLATLFGGSVVAQEAAAPDETFLINDLQLQGPPGWYQGPVEESGKGSEKQFQCVLASDEEAGKGIMIVTVVPVAGRSMAALQSMTKNFIVMRMDGVIEYERKKIIGGYPAQVTVYEGRSDVSAHRSFMRTVIERDGYFYILHGVSNTADFESQAPVFERLANSASWIE